MTYRIFFEMKREPFAADVDMEHILVTPALTAVSERVHYAMNIGAIALVTGEIGSGKSTAIRYVTEKLHPSEYRPLYIIATTGAIPELYRQLLHALGAPMKGVSKAIMVQRIRDELHELVQGKKLKTVLVIDEVADADLHEPIALTDVLCLRWRILILRPHYRVGWVPFLLLVCCRQISRCCVKFSQISLVAAAPGDKPSYSKIVWPCTIAFVKTGSNGIRPMGAALCSWA